MKNEKNKYFPENLVSNPTNFVDSFRKNTFYLLEFRDLSIRELAEKADMPFETLKSFLYGNSKDCKLSTAVKIAKAFESAFADDSALHLPVRQSLHPKP